MPFRRAALLALVLVLAAGAGCAGRAIKEGVGQVRGARGHVVPLREVEVDLSDYDRFVLGAIDDDFGGQVPDGFREALEEHFADELAGRGIRNASDGRTLRVQGRILHIEIAALTGLVLGDFEEVLARLELVDAASGRVLGVANCIGRSTESVNRGVRAKGEGLARAIVDWIERSYPEGARAR